jgi:hypothetical protein
MQQGEKPIFMDPTKYLEEKKWFHLDETYTPQDPWPEVYRAIVAETIKSIAELSDDIGFLMKLRRNTTDLDALGKIAQIIDLNLSIIKDLHNELAEQRKAYKLG